MIGGRLRKLREERGMEQKDLAESSGLSRSVISRMESGVNKIGNPHARFLLAKGLDMPVDKLNAYLDNKPSEIMEKLREALCPNSSVVDDIEQQAMRLYPEAAAVELHVSVARDGQDLTVLSMRYAWVGLLGADGFGLSSARGEPAATHQEALVNLLKLLQATG